LTFGLGSEGFFLERSSSSARVLTEIFSSKFEVRPTCAAESDIQFGAAVSEQTVDDQPNDHGISNYYLFQAKKRAEFILHTSVLLATGPQLA
jgi:hypothetical protein